MNIRLLQTLKQCSSVTTQTEDRVGSQPKTFHQGTSVTTQTDFLPKLVRRPSQPTLSGGRLNTLSDSTLPWSTTSCRGDTLQSTSKPELKLGPPGRVKTLAQHLEQVKLTRQEPLSARAPLDAFPHHRSMTALRPAGQPATVPCQEHKKACDDAAEAGRRGLSLGPDWRAGLVGRRLGPDWPRSRQGTIVPQVQSRISMARSSE